MLRQILKSKMHRARITAADVDYEGSIEIDSEMMAEVDLVEGEKVLVASVTSGNRLETYVQAGKPGSREVIINGGAAHLIKQGEVVVIMAFGLSEGAYEAKRIVLDENNRIIRRGKRR